MWPSSDGFAPLTQLHRRPPQFGKVQCDNSTCILARYGIAIALEFWERKGSQQLPQFGKVRGLMRNGQTLFCGLRRGRYHCQPPVWGSEVHEQSNSHLCTFLVL